MGADGACSAQRDPDLLNEVSPLMHTVCLPAARVSPDLIAHVVVPGCPLYPCGSSAPRPRPHRWWRAPSQHHGLGMTACETCQPWLGVDAVGGGGGAACGNYEQCARRSTITHKAPEQAKDTEDFARDTRHTARQCSSLYGTPPPAPTSTIGQMWADICIVPNSPFWRSLPLPHPLAP